MQNVLLPQMLVDCEFIIGFELGFVNLFKLLERAAAFLF